MDNIKVTFIVDEDKEIIIDAPVGLSILEVAHKNDIDLEGACEGSLACATCHVIVDEKFYEMLEDPTEPEEDMLDLAFGLTNTSRLGCQIILSKEIDGIRVRLPHATRNIKNIISTNRQE